MVEVWAAVEGVTSAPATVTYVGYSQGPTASALPTFSGTPVVGDYIVAQCTSRASGSWTVPSGYTLLRQDNTSPDLWVTSYGKVATSTEVSGGPGTFTSAGTSGYGVAVASVWRGVDTTTPVYSSGSLAGWVDLPQLSGITGGVYLGYVGWGWNDGSAPGWNPPVGGIAIGINSGRSWGLAGYVSLTSTRSPEPPGSTDYSYSLGTSATAILNQGLILRPAAASVSGPNLLTDTEATYETGLSTNWQVPPGLSTPVTINRVTTAHTGTYGMQLATTTSGIDPLQAILMRDVSVTAGASYTLSAWILSSRVAAPYIAALVFNSSGGFITVQTVFATTTGGSVSTGVWAQMTGVVTLPSGADHVRVEVVHDNGGFAGAGDTATFDDLYFGIGGGGSSGVIEVWG